MKFKDTKRLKNNTNTSNTSSSTSIEVHLFDGWYENSPRCVHGPMLLFEKFGQGFGNPQRFFACSASRQNGNCKTISESKFRCRDLNDSEIQRSIHDEVKKTLPNYEDILNSSYKTFCYTCQVFVLSPLHLRNDHCSHHCKKDISLTEMKQPSKVFITPIENNKSNAQYFMTSQSIQFMRSSLQKLNFKHFICIGVPRFHEAILSDSNTTQSSFLLDIDDRYSMFWSKTCFAKFNMFNHFFFENTGLESFSRFINDTHGKIAILMDPPFGGLVDCLSETIRWLSQTVISIKGGSCFSINQLLPVFWIFPYFFENRICNNLKEFNMLNYVVDYDNHKKFKNADTGRKMSPVRIFTNIANHFIALPVKEGYKFCSKCKRYVVKKEVHCKLCNNCPSKDGSVYWHCHICRTCVKPGRKHCFTCKRCELPTHQCKSFEGNLCHICGGKDHKRMNCPKRKTDGPFLNGFSKVEAPVTSQEFTHPPKQKLNSLEVSEPISNDLHYEEPHISLSSKYYQQFIFKINCRSKFITKRRNDKSNHLTCKAHKCKWLALASHQKTLASFHLHAKMS